MFDSKTIKNFILKPTNDLDELLNYLDKDFKTTIEGIFRALYPLLKLYNQNKGRVDYLLNIIEQIVDIKSSNELTCFITSMTNLESKVNKLPLVKRLQMHEPYQRIKKLLDKIETKSKEELNDSKLKYLEYLIFYDKNIDLVENLVELHPSILKSKNQSGDDIIEEVLKTYLGLDEKEIDKLEYYYQVLLVLLESDEYKGWSNKAKKKYIRMIKESKIGYKEHIIKVLELLSPNFKISISELEERNNFNYNFHEAILEEVAKIKLNHEGRVDYTYQKCITIDGTYACCLDDALWVEKQADGTYRLYIHIADVASIIPFDSIINEEARKRVKTWYLRKEQLLMYPEKICYDLGSLIQDEKRNVITYIFTLDDKFRLTSKLPEVKLGVINVRHRLSYAEVDNMYENQPDIEIMDTINYLANFALERRKSTSKKENYRMYENWINTQASHESLNVDTSISANIVHEAMFLVNYMIAKLFKELNLPYNYRKIIIPSSDYIDKQIEIIKQLDASIITDKTFINKLKESAMESVYSAEPVYHSGLKVECCSHSSSSLRRYADAFCQYIIHDLIIKKNYQNIPIWQYRVEELVKDLNVKERENARFVGEINFLSIRNKLEKVKKKGKDKEGKK